MKTGTAKRVYRAHGLLATVTAIVACAVMALALTACSGNGTKKETATKAETKTVDVAISVTADNGWDKDSTPAIAHVEGKGVDFYHAVTPGKKYNKGSATVKLVKGEYTVSFISPVNSDGSVYDVYATGAPVTVKVKAGSNKTTSAKCSMKQIPADKVTDDMLKDIVEKTKDAIKSGDKTLKGDAGKDILNKLDSNVASNPNASDGTKKDASDAGKDSGVDDAPASTTPATDKTDKGNTGSSNTGSTNTGNAGSGNQQSETTPVCDHHWVDHVGTFTIYGEQEVDVPDYADQQVAVGTKYTFSADGYTTTNDADAENHAYQLVANGQDSYYQTETIYETQRVQVGSHKETQQTSHTETRPDYKYCDKCGQIDYYYN